MSLRPGDEMTPEILLEALDEGGYVREDPVTAPGQMARRGGILDVFPSDREEPGPHRVLRRHRREPAALRPRDAARERARSRRS